MIKFEKIEQDLYSTFLSAGNVVTFYLWWFMPIDRLISPSYLKLQRCWLRSLTSSNRLSMLMGETYFPTYLQLQVV